MARSGTFKSALGKSGNFTESFDVTIAGTARTLFFDDLSISETAGNQPNTLQATCRIRGYTPSALSEIKIYNGGIGMARPIFCGHIMDVTQIGHRAAERPTFRLSAVDYRWLLDRYALVSKTYYSQGVNTILHNIVANNTNGGFKVGYCPSSLGDIDRIQFTKVSVSEAIGRLAKAVGATVEVDYEKRISIAVTHTFSDNNMTLSDNASDFWNFQYREDGTRRWTQVQMEGYGSTASAVVAAGATTIPVENTAFYSSAGGTVRSGSNVITYTTVSVGSGAGSLTGCSGVVDDIAAGEPVYVMATVNDSTEQTNLSTTLGGSYSGVSTHYEADNRLSQDEVTSRASALLAFYKTNQSQVSFTTTNPYIRPGRTLTVNLTTPRSISASLLVQEVRTQGRRKVDSTSTSILLDRQVTAAPTMRNFAEALADAGVR